MGLSKEQEKTPMSLLRNGAFETVDEGTASPAVWKVVDWSAPNARRPLKAVVEKDGMSPGKAAVRVVSESDGGNLVLLQDVKPPGGGTYLLTVACKPDVGACAYASVLALGGSKHLVYENTARVTDATRWTTLELAVSVPPETTAVRVILRTNRGASFADVSLVSQGATGSVGDTRQEPSSGKALQQKRSDLMYDPDADKVRKTAMSPEELAWEEVLEGCLGPFYLPRYKLSKERGQTTAWDFVKDDPALPRVLHGPCDRPTR